MHFKNSLIVGLLVATGLATTPGSNAADGAKQKDALTLISQMRVKQLTKELSLTEEQQKKVQALFDEEAKRLAVIQANDGLDINQKYEKKMAIKKESNENLPPLLTTEQKAKLEEMKTKPTRRKKPASPAPANP